MMYLFDLTGYTRSISTRLSHHLSSIHPSENCSSFSRLGKISPLSFRHTTCNTSTFCRLCQITHPSVISSLHASTIYSLSTDAHTSENSTQICLTFSSFCWNSDTFRDTSEESHTIGTLMRSIIHS